MKEGLLTVPQREALDRFVKAGGVAFVNAKKNGFDQFRAQDALALIIGNLVVVEMGELHLSLLGQMLTTSEIPTEKREEFVDWFVNRGPEYP
jgi:hypothetical protein